jgi:hypothetical protein
MIEYSPLGLLSFAQLCRQKLLAAPALFLLVNLHRRVTVPIRLLLLFLGFRSNGSFDTDILDSGDDLFINRSVESVQFGVQSVDKTVEKFLALVKLVPPFRMLDIGVIK